ncbi:MAG: hypothetical protein JWM72_1210, partial [Actinomycetia bacterium]|nr:hypothetical protein [Actinomycetes bacterium]
MVPAIRSAESSYAKEIPAVAGDVDEHDDAT